MNIQDPNFGNFSLMVATEHDGTRRFFFTDGHGWHRGRRLRELPAKWIPITTTMPWKITPQPGCEDGVVDTIEKYIAVFHKGEQQITVEDALREVGASTDFP